MQANLDHKLIRAIYVAGLALSKTEEGRLLKAAILHPSTEPVDQARLEWAGRELVQVLVLN